MATSKRCVPGDSLAQASSRALAYSRLVALSAPSACSLNFHITMCLSMAGPLVFLSSCLLVGKPRAHVDEHEAHQRDDGAGHGNRPAQRGVGAAGGNAQDQHEQAAVDQDPDPLLEPGVGL